MLNFVETIRRGNVVTVDGYSTLKYRKNAIKEIGRWIAENIDADEGNSIVEYTTEAMEPNHMDGGYFFEIEEVSCVTQYDEETDEMEYAEGNWYFCIRVITGFEEETEQQAETEPAEKYETEATAEQEPETQRYYYDQDEAAERQKSILTGEEAEPIKLHPATGCSELDYFYNPDSAWWPVHRYGESSTEPGEFPTLEEAETEFYTNEAESIYCYIHDC